MHIGDSPDEAAFRAEAAAWLTTVAAPRQTGESMHYDDLAAHVAECRTWQRTLYDNGWAGITWPKAFGGRGGTSLQASIFAEEQSRFDVSTGSFAVATGMVGPTLMAHGTPEQQQRYLDGMLRGDEVWCQLFSEPGAGSDLAGLGTRAVLDGDEWIVNGQKVWTSLGQFAEFGILLARTDPDVPKHRGITYFIVDMRSPGIEVRPLVQMTGTAHFNEVFLTDVRIPAANVVGEVGNGWKVAQTTLTS
jgi:alkylation response protein AidB-like acyl-CoA dehydrogenase